MHPSQSRSTCSRFAGLNWLKLLPLLLLTVSCTGCNVVLLLGYLIGGPPSIEPDFEKQTKKSLSARNTRVLVYCYAPNELKWDHDKIDYELAKFVASRLNQNDITVVDPDRVYAWIDKNPNFDKDTELGVAFNVNYVVKIDLREFSLFEEHSHDLFRGRCDGIISVLAMDKKDDGTIKKTGSVIYTKQLASRYPTSGPIATNQYPFDTFKGLYLSALSEDIGVKFYKDYAGNEFTRTAIQ